MIGIARLHAYSHQGVLWLVDVPQKEAKEKQRELCRMGWVVVHTELV